MNAGIFASNNYIYMTYSKHMLLFNKKVQHRKYVGLVFLLLSMSLIYMTSSSILIYTQQM